MMGRNTTRHGVEGSGSERELFSVADDTGYVRRLSRYASACSPNDIAADCL
jgi:hypothetical protein